MTAGPEPSAPIHLPRAPVVEATLYIRVQAPPAVTLETLTALHDRYGAQFPTRQSWMSDLPLGSLAGDSLDPPARTKRRAVGYMYTSPDGRDVVQARVDGFSLTRMKPYTSWAQLVGEARRLWDVYVDVVGPERIQYVGLRYINRVLIPASAERIEDYLLTVPAIAPGLAQEPAAFFMLLTLPRRDPDSVATVTVSSGPATGREDGSPIIFDIDVSANVAPALRGEELWSTLAGLREIKNDIFFQSMTDRARETFQ